MVRLKVRPFSERFNRGSMFPLLEISGRVVGERFVLLVDSGELVVPIVGSGTDAQGEYVWLKEAHYEFEGGVCLALKAQRQGEEILGTQMTFGGERASESRSSFTIFFGAHGAVDGQALVRPASEHPTIVH